MSKGFSTIQVSKENKMQLHDLKVKLIFDGNLPHGASLNEVITFLLSVAKT